MPTFTAPGLVLSPSAQVADDVQFGANVVVHGDTVIGPGVVIQDGVILASQANLVASGRAPWGPQAREAAASILSRIAAEEAARSLFGPLAFNCMAPDDGNMNLLAKVGTSQQQDTWLKPIVEGHARHRRRRRQDCRRRTARQEWQYRGRVRPWLRIEARRHRLDGRP